MDKPGSRPDSAERPLIIERPDLAHPVRRVLAPCLTALAWCAWLAMWLPLLPGAEGVAAALPGNFLSGRLGLKALGHLLEVFPLAIALLIVFLALNGVVTWLYRRLGTPRTRRAVDAQKLARDMELGEKELAAWQVARVLRVTHSPEGRVTDARIVR